MSGGAVAARSRSMRGWRVLAALCVVAMAIAACAASVVIVDRGRPFALAQGPAAILLELGAALALVAAGVIALARRRPFALVVVALGGAWAAREWANPAALGAVVFTLGLVLTTVWIPFAGWLALAYSRGLPARGRDRIVVGLGFAATIGPAAVRAAAFDPARHGCVECPANLMLVTDEPAVAASAAGAGVALALLACVVTLLCLVERFVRSSPAERLQIAPVVVTSAVALGFTAIGSAAALAEADARGTAQMITPAVATALIGVAVAVSWEIVRVGAARRRSARLVSDLSTAPGPGRLRDELAAITRDPSLDLAFPLDDRVVDTAGRTVADPRAVRGERMPRATVAVGRDGTEVALLTHRPGLLDDEDFRDAVARAAGLALEHERLQAELASRVSDLRRSRTRLVASFDAERRRLERDLHDGAQQQVVALLLELRLASARHPDPHFDEAIAEVAAALDELRELAHGIYPAALAEDGLGAALDQLREAADIPVRLTEVRGQRSPTAVETTAYAVVAETLRSPGLRSADVAVAEEDGLLRVTVSGVREGRGESAGLHDRVAGLADRVGAVGGELRIDDTSTSLFVRAELPCGS